MHRESGMRIEGVEERKESLLKRLQNVQEALPLGLKERGRDRDLLEVPEAPVGEVRSEIEPLDRVVEIDRIDPDVVSASIRLDELCDCVVLRFECVPRHRVSNLDPKVEGKIFRRCHEAGGKQQEDRSGSPEPFRQVATDDQKENLQALSDQEIDGRYRAYRAMGLRSLDRED